MNAMYETLTLPGNGTTVMVNRLRAQEDTLPDSAAALLPGSTPPGVPSTPRSGRDKTHWLSMAVIVSVCWA